MPRNTPITPKRGRNAVPSRVLIGRLGKGIGSEEILDLDEVAHAIAQGNNPLANSAGKIKEFLQIVLEGLFAADEFHAIMGPPVNVRMPTNGNDESIATAIFAGTNTTHFYLVTNVADYLVNGTSKICTVTFAAGALTGTFVYEPTQTLPAAIQVYIVCDHTPDPSLAGVELVFCGDPI